MTVLNSDNLTTMLSSETNENGEFVMNLTDVDDSILLDIENTTNSVRVDKSLLKMEELKTIILDRESISTDMELYLGVDIETRGACSIQKVNFDIFIQLESEKDDCTVNLRSLFGGNINTDSALEENNTVNAFHLPENHLNFELQVLKDVFKILWNIARITNFFQCNWMNKV